MTDSRKMIIFNSPKPVLEESTNLLIDKEVIADALAEAEELALQLEKEIIENVLKSKR